MSKPTIIEIWVAHGDGGERNRGPIIGYYKTKAEAEASAKGMGWYGGNGAVGRAHAVILNGLAYVLVSPYSIDLDRIQEKYDMELRAQTIAGLTAEQLRVLGIKEEK